MSYIVFARKYRPQAFDEVIGQSHITTTLKNAISQNRVAHAYIFAGPRGVGKTTTARILAKALNCEKGPSDNPCGKCNSCNEITQGISLDILEIDGASNRGIDEIRNLRENVKFSPSKGRFKIYIIDEVHMLTPEAFNALLKTLEEPPAHVKFIFATTQAHKVPSTILSRCQRFDFRRISTKDIVESLNRISKKEGISVNDEALILIARHSDGSMRDAQVVLDQISSFTEGKIRPEDASKILGAVSDDILFDLAGSINAHDPVKALKMIDELADEGKDIIQVILYLIEHFRNLSVIKVSKEPAALIDASVEKIARYKEQAEKFSIEQILYIIYTFSSTLDFARKSSMARVPLEVAFVKLTMPNAIMPSSELIERLEKLEQGLKKNSIEPVNSKKPVNLTQLFKEEKAPEIKDTPRSQNTALKEVVSFWPAVLNYIKERKISVAMYLQEGCPSRLESNTLSVDFPKSSQFHKDMLESPDCKGIILRAVKDVSGINMNIKFTISESGISEPAAQKNTFSPTGEESSPKNADEPIISEALEIFGGEVEQRYKKE